MATMLPGEIRRRSVDYPINTTVRFRRVPRARVLDETRERERECRDHTLMVTDDCHIECSECGAEWKDEGF